MPGVIVLQGPTFDSTDRENFIAQIEDALAHWEFRENYPWISIIDEGALTTNKAASTDNILSDFLWITFTRSDPAQDIYGLEETVEEKHWKCKAPLIIDARIKPQHQQQLTVPAEISKKAEQILKDAGVL